MEKGQHVTRLSVKPDLDGASNGEIEYATMPLTWAATPPDIWILFISHFAPNIALHGHPA